MAGTTVQQHLSNARLKLNQNDFPSEGLPKLVSDPLWNDIRNQYGLKLPEIAALKNASLGTTSIHVIPLFVDSYSNVRRLQQRLVVLRRRNFASLHSVLKSLVTVSQQHPYTTVSCH